MLRLGATLLAALALAGCGEPRGVSSVGPGPEFQPESMSRAVATASPVGDLTCGADTKAKTWVHVELFSKGRVVIVPAGIGVAPPRTQDGAYVRDGKCRYPLFTEEPTGLVGVARDGLTLGDLFEIWDRPLTRDRIAGFKGDVQVHLDGNLWTRDPGEVPLTRHAQIVVQAGHPRIEPHAAYRFPLGY